MVSEGHLPAALAARGAALGDGLVGGLEGLAEPAAETAWGEILKNFDHVLIPENNLGQLRLLVRAKYLVDAEGLNKNTGRPFTISEIETRILEMCS